MPVMRLNELLAAVPAGLAIRLRSCLCDGMNVAVTVLPDRMYLVDHSCARMQEDRALKPGLASNSESASLPHRSHVALNSVGPMAAK